MARSILSRLGLRSSSEGGRRDVEAPGIRLLRERLADLDPARARYIAAFALALGRVARADLEVSADEGRTIVRMLREHAELPEEQADLLVELLIHRDRLFGPGDAYVATRELKRQLTERHRASILSCLFAVTAADDSISLVEEEEVRQVASELGFSHQQYTAARAQFRDQREVLRGLRALRRPDQS